MLFPTPATDRLLYNLDNRLPSLCAYVFSHPNMVEVAGIAGMDAFMADMMFTAHDWDNIAHLIRAARGTGISPLIRVQAYPWATGTDRRTVSDAARALALGATAVTVSVSSKEEVQELMGLRDDWHRLIHLRRFNTAEEFPAFNEKTREGTLVVPTVESEGGLRDLDEILAMDGIRLVWLAAGDITKILGVPFKYDDPKVMRLLEHAVKTGEKHGAAIMYNMGLGLARLRRHGRLCEALLRRGRPGGRPGCHGVAHADGAAAHPAPGPRLVAGPSCFPTSVLG